MDQIAIEYQMTNEVYTFNDCLYLTQDQIDSLGESGLEQLKQERFDKWLEVISTPGAAPFTGEDDG